MLMPEVVIRHGTKSGNGFGFEAKGLASPPTTLVAGQSCPTKMHSNLCNHYDEIGKMAEFCTRSI